MPIPVSRADEIIATQQGNLTFRAFKDGRRVFHITILRELQWQGYEVDEAAFLSFLDSQPVDPQRPVAQF